MAYEETLETQTFEAGSDLSDKQYRIVKISADNTVDAAGGSTEDIIGVVQGTPESGDSAEVATAGITKVLVDSSGASAGDKVTADSNGKASTSLGVDPGTTDTGNIGDMVRILGKVVEGVTGGYYASVLIDKDIVG